MKAALMFCVVNSMKEDPLMTMGDAVASFVDAEDPRTEDVSLFHLRGRIKGYSAGIKLWTNPTYSWGETMSNRRRRINIGL